MESHLVQCHEQFEFDNHSNHRAYSDSLTWYMELYITNITMKALMIVCDWGRKFPTWKCWILYIDRIYVPCISKQEHEKRYTEKYLQDSFLTMHFEHTTRLGNLTYQICCSMNHFQQNDQNVLLFTFYKNPELSGFHSGKFDRSADL